MSADDLSRGATADAQHVRLRVELVVEIADPQALTRAALDQIQGDDLLPPAERDRASQAVTGNPAEAIAYLVDPFDLVNPLPGVELAQASWGSEPTEYDPDSDWGPEWDGEWDQDWDDDEV